MKRPKLSVKFYANLQGKEPVREWLLDLTTADRKTIGDEIRTVQFGWPIGMPLVRKLDKDLWEIRIDLTDRIARVLFTIEKGHAILLHSFIKKTQKIPAPDLATTKRRLNDLRTNGE
jgi:phage-related protein